MQAPEKSQSVLCKISRKLKPVISKTEGYDHINTGKTFLKPKWEKHEKENLLSSDNPPNHSKSQTEVKEKRKRLRKKAPEISRSGDHGENLVGSRIKVWWPLDKIYYEGVVVSFDQSKKKHKIYYDDGDEEILNLKKERWELVENEILPRKVSSPESCTNCVKGYKVKKNIAPILEAIFMKHGDIADGCVFKTASVRASFLELVCEVVTQLQTNDDENIISMMEEIESKVSEAEKANINVSWLRSRLEARKKLSLLMETKAKTSMAKKAAEMEVRERHEELMGAQQRFEKAERCVKVLALVEKKLDNNILDSKTEQDSWINQSTL